MAVAPEIWIRDQSGLDADKRPCFQRWLRCLLLQVVSRWEHQLGPHHHSAVLRLPHGHHRPAERHPRLLLQDRRLCLPLHCRREDRAVDRGTGRLGKWRLLIHNLTTGSPKTWDSSKGSVTRLNWDFLSSSHFSKSQKANLGTQATSRQLWQFLSWFMVCEKVSCGLGHEIFWIAIVSQVIEILREFCNITRHAGRKNAGKIEPAQSRHCKSCVMLRFLLVKLLQQQCFTEMYVRTEYGDWICKPSCENKEEREQNVHVASKVVPLFAMFVDVRIDRMPCFCLHAAGRDVSWTPVNRERDARFVFHYCQQFSEINTSVYKIAHSIHSILLGFQIDEKLELLCDSVLLSAFRCCLWFVRDPQSKIHLFFPTARAHQTNRRPLEPKRTGFAKKNPLSWKQQRFLFFLWWRTQVVLVHVTFLSVGESLAVR